MQFATIKQKLQIVYCFKNMNVISQISKTINEGPKQVFGFWIVNVPHQLSLSKLLSNKIYILNYKTNFLDPFTSYQQNFNNYQTFLKVKKEKEKYHLCIVETFLCL
jgi:hypothetical protein